MGHTGSLILWQRPGRVWLPVEQSSVTAGVQTLCLGLHIWTSLQLLLQVPIMTARRTPAICNLSKTDWGALTGYRRKQIQEWLLRQCVCRFWGKCRRPWATPVVCIKLMKINLGSCSSEPVDITVSNDGKQLSVAGLVSQITGLWDQKRVYLIFGLDTISCVILSNLLFNLLFTTDTIPHHPYQTLFSWVSEIYDRI